jgi:hypothetical protein
VFANTTIDVNSTDDNGFTPIQWAIESNELDAKHLVGKGANLFIKNDDGYSAIDHDLGPQLLQHAKDIRFASVKQFLFLSKACAIDTNPPQYSANPPQRRSARIEAPLFSARRQASVFGNPGLAKLISEFLLDTTIIVRDPSIPLPPKESDAVKEEGQGALLSESNKRACK